MRLVLEDYEKSGLTRREFCRRRGIQEATFKYWRRKHAAKPSMVAVQVVPAEPSPNFTLRLANGRCIESSWQFDDTELVRLIRIAESA
jgi:hypothetical protein